MCPHGPSWADSFRGDLNHDGVVDASVVQTQGQNAKTSEMWQGTQSGEAHFFEECSGRGKCNRASGECRCAAGFTGSACQRQECPSGCSGHGVCRTVREIAAGALNKRRIESVGGENSFDGVESPFTYSLWDADSAQACVCDPGYKGHNCAARVCPRGDDPLTTGKRYCGNRPCHWSTQEFDLTAEGLHIIASSFEDWRGRSHAAYAQVDTGSALPGSVTDPATELADASSVAGLIMQSLRSNFPQEMLQRVEVRAVGGIDAGGVFSAGVDSNGGTNRYSVTFVGVPGKQNLISISALSIVSDSVKYATATDTNGETYELTGNYEEIECAGRGACSDTSGLCTCFAGYYGNACEFQNALVF